MKLTLIGYAWPMLVVINVVVVNNDLSSAMNREY